MNILVHVFWCTDICSSNDCMPRDGSVKLEGMQITFGRYANQFSKVIVRISTLTRNV